MTNELKMLTLYITLRNIWCVWSFVCSVCLWFLTNVKSIFLFTCRSCTFFFIFSICQKSFCCFHMNTWNGIKKLHYLNMFNLANFVDFNFLDTTNTTPERDINKKDKSAAIGKIFKSIHHEKILVIQVGTVSSLYLLLLTGREIFKIFRKSETRGNYHAGRITPCCE